MVSFSALVVLEGMGVVPNVDGVWDHHLSARAQILSVVMSVVFTFMLASFPAGLVIYWAWNNFLSIIQQAVIMRKEGVKIEMWKNTLETLGLSKGGKETS